MSKSQSSYRYFKQEYFLLSTIVAFSLAYLQEISGNDWKLGLRGGEYHVTRENNLF